MLAVVALALVAGALGLPPRIAPMEGGLEVDVGDAQPGWALQLVRPTKEGEGAPHCVGPSTLLQEHRIQAGQQKVLFSAAELTPGYYCAVVVSPTENLTSLWPAEIKDPPGEKEESCLDWSATVTLKGDYNLHTIEATVEPQVYPGCEQVRVGLWLLTEQAALEGDCVHDIVCVQEPTLQLPKHSLEVRFEDLSPGNYCVRVTPKCSKTTDCLSLTSRVLELPLAPPSPLRGGAGGGGGGPEGRLLWLLLVPLLVVSALVMAGAVCWARRRAWLATRGKKATLPVAPGTGPPRQPPVEVRVVYSRDSEAHVAAVGQLCALLQSELGVRVEYDEAAVGPAHVTHDWALAMAHLPCPRFNEAPAGRVKMLVLESDGALLKHQAYRLHKDLGVASGSSVDELYHTTYAALLSQQAQALGDYCHLLVARLPYTTLPDRLDLVPEKRFLLPQHLPQLLEALLHDPGGSRGGSQQQRQRIAAALGSEARARLDRALALASSAHQGDGQGGLAHLRAVLLGQEQQV